MIGCAFQPTQKQKNQNNRGHKCQAKLYQKGFTGKEFEKISHELLLTPQI